MQSLETICSTFFAKVSAVAGFKTTSRRLRVVEDVASADQPALFMTVVSLESQVNTKTPTVWTLNLVLWIFVHTGGDENAIPSSIMNPLLNAVLESFAPGPIESEQTLGGLVHRCRVSGVIETEEGLLGDQAVSAIPVSIVFTD